MTTITILGLGAMGTRMAANLIAAGHDVTVWNRTRAVSEDFAAAHGATVADHPSEAAAGRQAVISMVRDDEAAAEVWLAPDHGALAAMAPGSLAIESSTLSPSTIRRLAEHADAGGVWFVEAPVVGSRPQADAGQLLHLVGGAADHIEHARPLLEVNANNVVHVGPIGSAAVLKLAVNGLFAVQVALYAEITALVDRTGVDTDQTHALLGDLPITSPGLKRILGLIRDNEFTPNFPVELVAKDLSYLRALADQLNAPAPLTETTAKLYAEAATGDTASLDISGIATTYR